MNRANSILELYESNAPYKSLEHFQTHLEADLGYKNDTLGKKYPHYYSVTKSHPNDAEMEAERKKLSKEFKAKGYKKSIDKTDDSDKYLHPAGYHKITVRQFKNISPMTRVSMEHSR